MTVPNRNYSSPEYRYGFQGQEKDDEVKGNGNSLNYKFRMHDPRVGRFFAVDPLTKSYPYYTPYSFSGNKVIAYGELEGLEETIKIYNGKDWKSIDKSQFYAKKWFEIRNEFLSQILYLFKNDQAVVFGYEKYFIEKKLDNGSTYIHAPENGTLFYDITQKIFEYRDTNENISSKNPIVPLILLPIRDTTRKISDIADVVESVSLTTTVFSGGLTSEITVPIAAISGTIGQSADVVSITVDALAGDKDGLIKDGLNFVIPLGANKLFVKKIADKIVNGVSERAMKSRELLIKAIDKIILKAKDLTIPIHKPEPDKYKNNDDK